MLSDNFILYPTSDPSVGSRGTSSSLLDVDHYCELTLPIAEFAARIERGRQTSMSLVVLTVYSLCNLLVLQGPDSPDPARTHTQQAPGGSESPLPLAKWAFVVSIIALGISGTTAYFQLRTHQAKKPVINIAIDGLPPYESPQDRTLVTITNDGTAATTRQLDVRVDCSWMPLISYRLNLPDKYCLEPNEHYWWRIRLNDQLVPNSMVKVTVWDSRRDHWQVSEHLETPQG